MSLYDLQQRTEIILKKYAKYDAPLQKQREGKSDDPFMDEYDALDAQVEALIKAKQQLLTEGIEGLQKKLKKGKGVTKVLVEERQRRVKALIDKIYAVPDGMGGARRPMKIGGKLGAGGSPGGAVVLSTSGPSGLETNPLYYKGSEETQRFEQEWEHSKRRQDAQLERMERGVGTLADMARSMQEELDRQSPVVEDIDRQLNRVTSKLKSNNAKLRGLVLQMRSRRNFCIDIILVCVVLGIIAYIVSMVQKRKGQ
ncbi:hypothetical protein Rsub_02990 [Raphidocelis subcapitata]|uniref:t-SNARE coiled-coil homology domain-containing protein n=1 Tax=Raphidocelis subcapitata TaxID=307507 RepID=A0A2V0NYM4_9CHLO|nr:hypothetical protein Rsub_02990 [Raphidocelis subcapitata]|eukprot:GBF90690.1 hypothetical protein Rsub_02990 [Raphidocelis subcapitata]